ncbi:hypothetical protein Tco_1062287 [Tanacetum coccineum]
MSTFNNTSFEFSINYNKSFLLTPLLYQDSSHVNIHVPTMDLEEMVGHILFYALPPNYALKGMKVIKNDYDINVIYDIGKVTGKLEVFESELPRDLSTMLILNDSSLEEAFIDVISEDTKKGEEAVRYLTQM